MGQANCFCWPRAGVLTVASMIAAGASVGGCRQTKPSPQSPTTTQPAAEDIVLTIVYDNNPGREGLTPAWGFGCVIQGLAKTILFDTGGDGRVLLQNMRQLGFDPEQIDAVVLSHIHGDHTGGLPMLLEARGGVPVYVPSGFPPSFLQRVRALGGQPFESGDSVAVCPGARTTGTLGIGAIEEHGLCVRTQGGWVLVTGCAHPGVAELAARARDVTGGPIHLVVGGFHMGGYSEQAINAVIDRFEQLGVQRAAPCHCTGETARSLFKKRYGDRCVLPGVGEQFRLAPAR